MGKKIIHEYPSCYGRGVDPDLDRVWDVLDLITPGVIPMDVRSYLAGAMMGLMLKARTTEKANATDKDTGR